MSHWPRSGLPLGNAGLSGQRTDEAWSGLDGKTEGTVASLPMPYAGKRNTASADRGRTCRP